MVDIRIAVRVRPGGSRTRVGGSYGADAQLVVAVHASPVDGAANDSVVDAVAEALGLRRRQVRLVSGRTSRSKVLGVDVPAEEEARVRARILELLA
ncbi:MAG: DUF167 domain-containing protein [Candidatus Nanopelagicales bacterium]